MRFKRLYTQLRLLVAFIGAVVATAAAVSQPVSPTIEVFTTGDQWPGDLIPVPAKVQLDIRIRLIDGIRQLEANLSRNLPADSRAAEREVLRRLQALDENRSNRVKASAEALLRATELGVDRYPAIVLDGKFVAYGTTDLKDAMAAYRQHSRRTP